MKLSTAVSSLLGALEPGKIGRCEVEHGYHHHEWPDAPEAGMLQRFSAEEPFACHCAAAFAEKMMTIIKKIEWSDGDKPQCPYCEREDYEGHHRDCLIGQVLLRTPDEEPEEPEEES